MRDDQIVLGQVGYGYWGPNILRNLMECREAEVKYVCDKKPEQLTKAQRRYPSIIVTQDFRDLLNDPEVDGVLITTTVSTHYELARAALLARKHVFVEKPLASTVGTAEELVALAKAQSRTLMVGHTFEYSPPVIKIKELIDAGELGEIYYVSSSRVNLGLHQRDVSVIWDLAPHDFSILLHWLDEEPAHISAYGRACVQPGVADVAFVNLSFQSGTVAQVQLSWLSPIKLRRTVIVGSKKMLLYDDTESVEKVKLFDHGVNPIEPNSFGEFQLSYRTGDILSPRIETHEPLYMETKHFCECIMTGRTPRSDGWDGLRVVRALERADASLKENGNLAGGKDRNGDGRERSWDGSSEFESEKRAVLFAVKGRK